MPTYRYRCGECGEEFEVWQSIKDDSLPTHDEGCGGPLVKVLTPAGIVLKGSGFYKNDSRSSGRHGSSRERDANRDGDSSDGESKSGDSKSGESKSGDSKSGESKSGESKSGDSKSGESKSGDSKSGGSKSGDQPKTGAATS
jgi:putative FmdB family regulatory protein